MLTSRTVRNVLLTLALALIPSLAHAEEVPETLVPLRTHSIYAPYVDQDLQNRWFDFGGEAYINTNKYIRLTQDRASETGWLWSRLPLTVNNFQIDIEFKISGGSSHLFGDGMAIWITKTRAEYGPVFGSRDLFEGFGLFLDTYANARHSYSFPRVMGMIGDGTAAYDLGSDGDAQAAGACSASIRRNDIKTKARIIYKKGVSLQVKLQYKGWDEWTPCFEIKNVTLPSTPYLGLTAITGEVHDAHDVISIASSSLVVNQQPPKPGSPRVKKGGRLSDEQEGSWVGSFFKFLIFLGVCGGAYYGYTVYYVRGNAWSNKRF